MHDGPAGNRGPALLAGSSVVVLAAWNNVLLPRTPGYPGSYAAVNTAAATALLAAARAAGLSWAELGLAPGRLAAGARSGGSWAGAVAAGYAAALAVPALRPLLRDARITALSPAELAAQVLVRIPLGTVVWEELAFRGVLPAALGRVLPRGRATAVAATVFGVWHVRPTVEGLAANGVPARPGVRSALVLAACAGTAGAGLLFSRLRERSGSLLSPALVHLATNALGALAAAAAGRAPVSRPRTGARVSRTR